VQEAEALEAIKARMLGARHVDGGDGGAPGMLIDKPGEGVEEQEEQEDSVPADQSQDGLDATAKTTKSAPQRKTKQQRRKAEKLRSEVCGLNLPSPPPFSSSVKNTTLETCPLGAHPAETVACVCRHCQELTQCR
jgi:hypothetical protein